MNALSRVVLGLAPLEEEAIEDALYGSPGLRVLASGADAGELLELVAAARPELVLVSADLPGLDRSSLARLQALGPRLAGLALDGRAAARLEALALEHVLRSPLEPAALLALLDEREGAVEPPRPSAARLDPETPGTREGSVIAFLGGKGAPGASELALSFAALLARGHRVILAELDADGGGLASRLGIDPREGSLLGLVRALAADDADAPALLPHWVVAGVRGWPAVLPGLPDAPAEVAEVSNGLVTRALELLASSYPLVVCDLGQRLRAGGGDLAVSLHREVALAADALVVVIGARPAQLDVGLAQVELLLGELRLPPASLRVVVCGQPGVRTPRPGAVPGLVAALAERGVTVDGWLPHDERALRAAQRRGLPLALAARRGRYARAVAALAELILLPSLPRPAARKRRLLAIASLTGEPAGVEEVPLPWRR